MVKMRAVAGRANRLPKHQILRTNEEFRNVFRNAYLKKKRDCMRLFLCRNDHGYPRIGIVVAKRYIPTSTRRNLIKRQVRELFRHHAPASSDMVVMVQDQMPHECSRRIVRTILEHLWNAAGIDESS
jgi:ribonuclease P protein component